MRARYTSGAADVRIGMRHPAPSPRPAFRRSYNTIQYTSFLDSLCAAPYGEVPPLEPSSFADEETDPALEAHPDNRGARVPK